MTLRIWGMRESSYISVVEADLILGRNRVSYHVFVIDVRFKAFSIW